MASVTDALTEQIGPLPVWAWGVAIIGGLGVGWVIQMQRTASTDAPSSDGEPAGGRQRGSATRQPIGGQPQLPRVIVIGEPESDRSDQTTSPSPEPDPDRDQDHDQDRSRDRGGPDSCGPDEFWEPDVDSCISASRRTPPDKSTSCAPGWQFREDLDKCVQPGNPATF